MWLFTLSGASKTQEDLFHATQGLPPLMAPSRSCTACVEGSYLYGHSGMVPCSVLLKICRSTRDTMPLDCAHSGGMGPATPQAVHQLVHSLVAQQQPDQWPCTMAAIVGQSISWHIHIAC